MATFEELDKRYEELEDQQSKTNSELNDLKYKWYDAYIATDEVKNNLGKCFKVTNQDVYYKVISPAPLRSGRAFVDVAENHYVCLVTSHSCIDNYTPESIETIIPIWTETKYLLFGTGYFKDEEITPIQFDGIVKDNLRKLNNFLNLKISNSKTNPKAEMLFRF